MIKLTGVMYRKPDWSRQEWLNHYKEHHGSLALSIRSYMDNVVRYVQNYSLAPPDVPDFPELLPEIMGVAELTFHDVAGFERATNSKDYMTYLRPDEISFISDKSLASIGAESIIFQTEDTPRGDKRFSRHDKYKIVGFRTRPEGMQREAFQNHWRQSNAVMAKEAAFYRDLVRRHVQTDCVTPDELPGDMPVAHYDLIDELWFGSLGDAVSYWSAVRYSAYNRGSADAFNPAAAGITFVEEHQALIPMA